MALLQALGKVIAIIVFGVFCWLVIAVETMSAIWAGWAFIGGVLLATFMILAEKRK